MVYCKKEQKPIQNTKTGPEILSAAGFGVLELFKLCSCV